MGTLFEILHEDDRLLVLNKPAGLVCHPTKGDELSSLISRVRLHLGPEVEPQLINRLDRETSGVVIVAKDATTARAWRRQWEQGAVGKSYLAIVHGHAPAEGVIDAPLGRDVASRVAIKDCVRSDGAMARTEFHLLRHFTRAEGEFSVLEVRPASGRKHQIRIHLAHAGHAIVGDKLYGGDEACYLDFVAGQLTEAQRRKLLLPCHALHAARVTAQWEGRSVEFVAEAKEWFGRFERGELVGMIQPAGEAGPRIEPASP